jgi:hypothetical protein
MTWTANVPSVKVVWNASPATRERLIVKGKLIPAADSGGLRHIPRPASASPGGPAVQTVLDELREDRV